MSKSLRRVKAALAELGLEDTICETAGATTVQMAADAVWIKLANPSFFRLVPQIRLFYSSLRADNR